MTPLHIERLEPWHWPTVRAVYQEGLDSGHASFETVAPDWPTWDAAHFPHPRIVAERHSVVVGFAALAPVSRRAAYRGVAEVSLYVAAAARGEGIGRALLNGLIERSESSGIWTLQASIFPENEASMHLHEACGFRLVGRRERIAQHDGKWRDTVLYERRSALTSG
jgi:phosphinothricin acetyltransferase